MDSLEHVTRVLGVDVYAAEQEYLFMIAGAVCAMQDYTGIRVTPDDPEYQDELEEIFTERACRALSVHANGLGPVYV